MERFWSRNDTRLSAVGRFWDREGSPYGVIGAGVEGYRRCVHGGIIAREFVGIKAAEVSGELAASEPERSFRSAGCRLRANSPPPLGTRTR